MVVETDVFLIDHDLDRTTDRDRTPPFSIEIGEIQSAVSMGLLFEGTAKRKTRQMKALLHFSWGGVCEYCKKKDDFTQHIAHDPDFKTWKEKVTNFEFHHIDTRTHHRRVFRVGDLKAPKTNKLDAQIRWVLKVAYKLQGTILLCRSCHQHLHAHSAQ
jgi:hypothetical protein